MLPSHTKRGLDESPDEMLDTQDLPAKRRRYETPTPDASPAPAPAASPLVIPDSDDLDLDAAVSLPDAIELPPGETARKRRHSGDSAPGSHSNEEELQDEDAPARQRRHTAEPGFRLVIPDGFTRSIPSVVLEDGPMPLGPPGAPCERRGPVIEEVPYNPLAIVPYMGPPPEVALPPEAGGSPDDGGGTPPPSATPPPPSQQGMETEGDEDGSNNGVIQMLTPLECGSMDRMGSAASMDIG